MSRFIKSKVRSIRDGRAFVGVGAIGVAKADRGHALLPYVSMEK